jgi:hypothetical protein
VGTTNDGGWKIGTHYFDPKNPDDAPYIDKSTGLLELGKMKIYELLGVKCRVDPTPRRREWPILERARKRWKIAIEAEEENRTKQLDDLKFLAASPDDQRGSGRRRCCASALDSNQEGGPRPCLTINKLPQHHRQVTNEQRMNRPQIKVRPVDDKGDPRSRRSTNGICATSRWRPKPISPTTRRAMRRWRRARGTSASYTEYCDERSFDQDIVIAPIADRFKVYMDPIGLLQHPAGKKCQWGFIIEDLPKEEYEDLRRRDPIDWSDAGIGDQLDWFPNKDTVRIAEYFEIEKKRRSSALGRAASCPRSRASRCPKACRWASSRSGRARPRFRSASGARSTGSRCSTSARCRRSTSRSSGWSATSGSSKASRSSRAGAQREGRAAHVQLQREHGSRDERARAEGAVRRRWPSSSRATRTSTEEANRVSYAYLLYNAVSTRRPGRS